jgi:hypothetical protein
MIDPTTPGETAVISNRTVRQFAAILLAIGLALVAAWVFEGTRFVTRGAAWAGGVALALGTIGVMYPPFMRPIFLLAMTVTRPIGHVISLVILAILYFGIFTPLGLVFRALRRDALALKGARAATYWEPWPATDSVMAYTHLYQSQQTGITYDQREQRSEASIAARPAATADD